MSLITDFLHSKQKVTDKLSQGYFFVSFSRVVTQSPDRTSIVCSEITREYGHKTSVSAFESLALDHLQSIQVAKQTI